MGKPILGDSGESVDRAGQGGTGALCRVQRYDRCTAHSDLWRLVANDMNGRAIILRRSKMNYADETQACCVACSSPRHDVCAAVRLWAAELFPRLQGDLAQMGTVPVCAPRAFAGSA